MYGRSFEEISKIYRPGESVKAWGSIKICVDHKKFKLYKFKLKHNESIKLKTAKFDQPRLFLSSGKLIFKSIETLGQVDHHRSINIHPGAEIEIFSSSLSEFFIFSKNRILASKNDLLSDSILQDIRSKPSKLIHIGNSTYDLRDKYWGKIETIFSAKIAGKIMNISKGIQGSLEYHLEKVESYYIESGKLSVGLRFGRAEDKNVILSEGDSFIIEPGTMHSRKGLTDCKVIEISTEDNDSDSFLVTDGSQLN